MPKGLVSGVALNTCGGSRAMLVRANASSPVAASCADSSTKYRPLSEAASNETGISQDVPAASRTHRVPSAIFAGPSNPRTHHDTSNPRATSFALMILPMKDSGSDGLSNQLYALFVRNSTSAGRFASTSAAA